MKSNYGCIFGLLAFAVVFTLIATGLSKVGILPPDLESRSFSEDVGSSIIIVLIVIGLFYLLSSIGIFRKTEDRRLNTHQQPPSASKSVEGDPDEEAEYNAFCDPNFNEEPDDDDLYDDDEYSEPIDDPEPAPAPIWYVKPGEGIGHICLDKSTLTDVVASFGDHYKIEKREPAKDTAVYVTGLAFSFCTMDPEQIIRSMWVPTSFPAVLNVNGTLIPFSELLREGKLRDELITYHERGWRYSKDEAKWFLCAHGAFYYADSLNTNGIDGVYIIKQHLTEATLI